VNISTPLPNDLRATPLTENCEKVFATAQHITVGISPFNSYFSLARIHQILEWALAHFAYVDVFLPGTEAQNNLIACGYSETDARRSATKAINKMRNRAVSALLALGVGDAHAHGMVHSLSDLCGEPAYESRREQAYTAFERDPNFRAGCEQMAHGVLKGRLDGDVEADARQLSLMIPYLFAELPVLIDSPAVLGVPASVTCYHSIIPIVRPMFEGKFDLVPSKEQGYLVLATPEARSTQSPQAPSIVRHMVDAATYGADPSYA
jgi:cyclo(L-tyrosyl-L-tyrosyl) synthase